MKTIIVAIAALALSGCAGMMYQSMTPEQITAAAKDNKAVFQCADFPSIGGGVAKVRSMIIDSGTVRYGQFVAEECGKITFTNDNKPPAPTTVPVQVTPAPMQLAPVPQRYAPPPPPTQ